MTYTPEQRADDGEIALAMGWQAVTQYDGLIGGPGGFPPDAPQHTPGFIRSVPRFHESHDARAALLEWLAADDGRWHRFDDIFYRNMQRDGRYRLYPVEGENDYCRAAFLASPAQVAEAALRVIKESEGGKA